MTRFSKIETDYLKSQRIARIATVSRQGQPDVVPVVLEFDGEYFWVGSHNDQARKYKNVRDGNRSVALTIDDVESYQPWKARAIRVYGTADVVDHQGLLGRGKYLRITPKISWSFGLEDGKITDGHDLRIVKTVHQQTSP
jgi:pyridoxamine 5'-phosphate oxidase family protein